MAEHEVTAEETVGRRFHVPPLTARLVGRPVTEAMTPAYARLCLQYVGAVRLRRGTVGLWDFTDAALADPQTLELGRRLRVVGNDNPDPNALAPQYVEVDLAHGRTVICSVASVLGAPRARSQLMPLAPSLTCAGAPLRSSRSTRERRCGMRSRLSKLSKMFA